MNRTHFLTLTLAALLGLAAAPASAQTTVPDTPAKNETAVEEPVVEAPKAVAAPTAPAAPTAGAPKMPEPPKPTGPTYNPPPPSGKDWGKLPQESREQILNDWKALSEKDREPFIFYRERAMAKLPDSAYSDNPYKPDAAQPATAAAASSAKTVTAPAASGASGVTTTEEKSSGGSFFDKLMGKDDATGE